MKWMQILLHFRWVRKIAKATISLVVSVCLSVRLCVRKTSAPPGRIFIDFDIWVFFENLSIKIKFHYHLARITGTLHEDQYAFLFIFRWILLRMKTVSDKICRELQNKFMFKRLFFFRELYRLGDNKEKYSTTRQGTDDNIKRLVRFACWIPKATNTHSEYVILIAFPLQQSPDDLPQCHVIRTLPVL